MHGNMGVYRQLGYFNSLSYLKKKKKTAKTQIHGRVVFFGTSAKIQCLWEAALWGAVG